MTIEKRKCKRSKLKGSSSHPIIRFYFLPAFRIDISDCGLLPFLGGIEGGDRGCMQFRCFFVRPNILEIKPAFLDSNGECEECVLGDFV